MDTKTQNNIALLIDWENIKYGLADCNVIPNISAILGYVRGMGRVTVSKAYSDFVSSSMQNDPRKLHMAGVEPVYVPGKTYTANSGNVTRKNSIDVRLTADCVSMCYQYPQIGTYVLVSGDGDFIHLINTIRRMGKEVHIIALSWSISALLIEQSDSIIYYDKEIETIAKDNNTSNSEQISEMNNHYIPKSKGYTPPYTYNEEDSDDRYILFTNIPTDMKQKIIKFAIDLENKSRYITFRYLTSKLSEQVWMQWNYRYMCKIVDSAVASGIFTQNIYTDINEYTGEERNLPVIAIDQYNEEVMEVIADNQ